MVDKWTSPIRTYKDLQVRSFQHFLLCFFWYVFKMFFSMFYHSKPPSNQHLVDIFVPSILSKSLVFLGGKGGGAGRVKNS